MIKKIIFDCETITPMFLSGADQHTVELRAASIKGLLRFWWRAIQAESDLESLRNIESKIFGSSDEKTGGGSSFSIQVTYTGTLKGITSDLPKHNIAVTSHSRGKTFNINILDYLAYGPCSYDKDKRKNVIVREYIQHCFKFTIQMTIFREEFLNDVLKAIYVFNLFGGIGSKSRNGFGGFSISNNEECFNLLAERFALHEDRYSKVNLLNLIKQSDKKTYPSFTKETRVFKAKELYNTWDKALGEVGKIYRGIRSGDINIATTDGRQTTFEKHFKYDKRQYIGSPIIVDKQEKSFLDRHAKPYFIKIGKEGDKYRSYILYLPSRYCVGLERDSNGRNIDHYNVDSKFIEVCAEFNNFLSQNMETIL